MKSTLSFFTLIALSGTIPTLAVVQEWGQCGGNNWTGDTQCAAGLVCQQLNPWYHQCLKGSGPTTTQPPPIPTTTTRPTTTPTTPTTIVDPPPITTTTTTGQPPPVGTCPALPGNISLTAVTSLPDPFLPVSGGSRITTKAQWECRRQEIFELLQRYELGDLPAKPTTTGSLSGNTLTVNVSANGKSISFTASISFPSGNGPFPAIIAYGMFSIPRPSNVAGITFNNDDIAAQQGGNSRGQGKFYTLYGSSHSAGALTAWAWGVSRIIDALESIPNSRIRTDRIGVTGCSRNGKGAIVAGALEPRIALTIPQESGSGGAACWRISNAQKSAGQDVQTAPQIIGENVWFSTRFNTYTSQINNLPFDHHSLAGLVAPRGLLVIENTSMTWLGNLSTYGCQRGTKLIYQALGASANMGYSQVGHSDHCGFPSSQQPELTAFINKFLLDGSGNTDIFKTDGNFNFNAQQWTPWTAPTLT